MSKMVEVSEEELLQSKKLRDTLAKVVAHPKAKLLLQQAHKLVDPAAITPELDAQQPLDERFSAVQTELNEFKKQVAEAREKDEREAKTAALLNQVEEGIAKLRRAGWTDEGITGVRKLMDEKGILDPEIAAAYFEKQHPPQAPVTPNSGNSWNLFDAAREGADSENLKALLAAKGDSEPITDRMISQALSDIRGQSR